MFLALVYTYIGEIEKKKERKRENDAKGCINRHDVQLKIIIFYESFVKIFYAI